MSLSNKHIFSPALLKRWRKDPKEFVKYNLRRGYRYVTLLERPHNSDVCIVDLFSNKPKNVGLKGVTYWEANNPKQESREYEKVSKNVVTQLGISKSKVLNLNKLKLNT